MQDADLNPGMPQVVAAGYENSSFSFDAADRDDAARGRRGERHAVHPEPAEQRHAHQPAQAARHRRRPRTPASTSRAPTTWASFEREVRPRHRALHGRRRRPARRSRSAASAAASGSWSPASRPGRTDPPEEHLGSGRVARQRAPAARLGEARAGVERRGGVVVRRDRQLDRRGALLARPVGGRLDQSRAEAARRGPPGRPTGPSASCCAGLEQPAGDHAEPALAVDRHHDHARLVRRPARPVLRRPRLRLLVGLARTLPGPRAGRAAAARAAARPRPRAAAGARSVRRRPAAARTKPRKAPAAGGWRRSRQTSVSGRSSPIGIAARAGRRRRPSSAGRSRRRARVRRARAR